MNEEEIQPFLDRSLTAIVSTVGRMGNAHSVPVWYRFADGSFRIWTDGSRAWVKNARRHPQMSVASAKHEASSHSLWLGSDHPDGRAGSRNGPPIKYYRRGETGGVILPSCS